MPFPGPGTAAASDSGRRVHRVCVCTVVSLLCLTYVRGPDYKAGLHFYKKSPSWHLPYLGLCRGISGGNLSRLPVLNSSRQAGAPTLPHTKDLRSISGETVTGDLSFWRKLILDNALPARCQKKQSKAASAQLASIKVRHETQVLPSEALNNLKTQQWSLKCKRSR